MKTKVTNTYYIPMVSYLSHETPTRNIIIPGLSNLPPEFHKELGLVAHAGKPTITKLITQQVIEDFRNGIEPELIPMSELCRGAANLPENFPETWYIEVKLEDCRDVTVVVPDSIADHLEKIMENYTAREALFVEIMAIDC